MTTPCFSTDDALTVLTGKRHHLSMALVILVVVFATGCSRKKPAPAEVIRPVRTTLVSAGGENNIRIFSGRVEASKQVELAFQVPGLLVSLPVREGQSVAKNEVIAQLRQDEFQARLSALQGQLDTARANLLAARSGARPEERLRLESQVRSSGAQLANARAEFGRFSQLLRSQTISRLEFERAETAYHVAQENFRAAQQTLEQGMIGREEDIQAREAEVRGLEGRVVEANIQLQDSTLRAPYDGVIAQRFVEQGQNVQAKQAVVRFQDANELEIAVDVPETVMAADIRSADIVQMLAEFSAVPGLQFPVHIKEIAQRADPITQTFTVRVAMETPPNINVLPGMSATVTLTYRRAEILGSRLLIPLTALSQNRTSEQAVWILEPDQTVTRRPVKIGEATGGQIEVVDGLQPGDRIAVAGVTFLREGMKVRDLGDAFGSSQP
jgi:membrane fusion protein, multidrug efflux system